MKRFELLMIAIYICERGASDLVWPSATHLQRIAILSQDILITILLRPFYYFFRCSLEQCPGREQYCSERQAPLRPSTWKSLSDGREERHSTHAKHGLLESRIVSLEPR